MKLLFYVDNFSISGTAQERQLVYLCRALAARKHEIHILADEAGKFPMGTVHRDLSTAVELCGRILPDLCIDWRLEYPADIHYLGRSTYDAILRARLDATKGLRKLWQKFSYAGAEHRQKAARQYSLLANPAASFLATSELIAGQAVEDGAERERISVHHLAVDPANFHPKRLPEFRAETREHWKAQPGDVFFLVAAEDLAEVDLRLLKQTFERITGSCDAKLVIASPQTPEFAADWLICTSLRPNMLGLYAGADALLHPTHFDIGSEFVAEAMACARPVVVSDKSGINEIVRHGQDGSVLPVAGGGACRVWADTISSLSADTDLRNRQGVSAFEASQTRSHDRYIDWFESYLAEVRRQKMLREDLV